MPIKKKCTSCGDEFKVTEEDSIDIKLCDECFQMYEGSQTDFEYEQHSDADSGL